LARIFFCCFVVVVVVNLKLTRVQGFFVILCVKSHLKNTTREVLFLLHLRLLLSLTLSHYRLLCVSPAHTKLCFNFLFFAIISLFYFSSPLLTLYILRLRTACQVTLDSSFQCVLSLSFAYITHNAKKNSLQTLFSSFRADDCEYE
jgi:hypothetical protein